MRLKQEARLAAFATPESFVYAALLVAFAVMPVLINEFWPERV